jgi:HlyD family secretion protein
VHNSFGFAVIETEPFPLAIRLSFAVCALLLVSAVVWATVFSLDRIVVSDGYIVTPAPNIELQPMDAGLIRRIRVEPGQMVKAGDVLMELDPTLASADLAGLQLKLDAREQDIAQLQQEVELIEHPEAQYPASSSRPTTLRFETRLAAYMSRRGEKTSDVARMETEISYLRRSLAVAREELGIVGEVVAMRQTLMAKESGSKLNYLLARQSYVGIEGRLRDMEGQIESRVRQIAGIQEQILSLKTAWLKDATEQIETLQRDANDLREQLRKAKLRADVVALKAPEDGIVLDVVKQSIGSVARAGDTLVVIVPTDQPLEVDCDISNQDIGVVRVGDPVKIKIDAFPYQKYGLVAGKVQALSEGLLSRVMSAAGDTDDAGTAAGRKPGGAGTGGRLYYRAKVSIEEIKLRGVPADYRLLPGMKVSAEIKVGERSVLSYVIYPMMKAFGTAMREP